MDNTLIFAQNRRKPYSTKNPNTINSFYPVNSKKHFFFFYIQLLWFRPIIQKILLEYIITDATGTTIETKSTTIGRMAYCVVRVQRIRIGFARGRTRLVAKNPVTQFDDRVGRHEKSSRFGRGRSEGQRRARECVPSGCAAAKLHSIGIFDGSVRPIRPVGFPTETEISASPKP